MSHEGRDSLNDYVKFARRTSIKLAYRAGYSGLTLLSVATIPAVTNVHTATDLDLSIPIA